MSYQRFLKGTRWYSLFAGLWTEDSIGDIPVDHLLQQSLVARDMRRVDGAMYLTRANNVYAPGVSRVLRKRPGFTAVNSTAINAAGIFTSFIHLGEIADEFLATVSIAGDRHSVYRYSADPPVELAGGANFTISADNMVTPLIFGDGTNPGVIFVSRQRDTHQFVTGTPTRSSLPVAGTDLTELKAAVAEIFAQRALYGDVDFDGTVHDDRVYWSALRDGNLIDDPSTDFISFETKLKDRVRGIHKLSDICGVFKLNNVFTMVPTPEATNPFMIQEEPAGRNRGAVSQQAILEAMSRLWWLGQSNVHSIDQNFIIRDHMDAIQPTIRGLSDSRRDFAIAGLDTERSLILFNVSDSGDTTNDLTIALNYKTGAIYLWTLRRNAFGYREVSGQIRLIGGGYAGLSYNELTGTSGNLDDATAVIGADVITPKLWVNSYGTKQKIPYVLLSVDPVGSESITVTYALDDEDILTSPRTPDGSPYTVSGTDHRIIFVPIGAFAERIQLRFFNDTADQVYNIKAVGIPSLVAHPVNA